MPNIYIKLKDKSETVYFQSIMGTYSHIAWVRTQDPENGIMQITPTEDQVAQVKEILNYLRNEIEFEDVDEP
jgi:alkyl hydroperoxide reductase subunit AhpC